MRRSPVLQFAVSILLWPFARSSRLGAPSEPSFTPQIADPLAPDCSKAAPDHPASPPVASRSTPNPKKRTNMLAFFAFCGARLSGRQAEGVAGALQLGP